MVERSFFTTYQLELAFVILFFVMINIIFIYLYRYSELISKRTVMISLFTINTMIIATVVSAYTILKPPPIEKRVIFIPEFSNDESQNKELILITNQIEQNLRNSNQRKMLIMSYWWIFDSMNKEYSFETAKYLELAGKANVHEVYVLKKTSEGISITGPNFEFTMTYTNSDAIFESSKSALLTLSGHFEIDLPEVIRDYNNPGYINALMHYYYGEYDELISMAETIEINEKTMLQNIVISRAFINKGAGIQKNVNFDNPYHNQEYLRNFRDAQQRLFVYVNKDPFNPDLYIPLIELQLFQENYDDADASIKAYLTDFGTEAVLRRSEPEIFYFYSFLNSSKIAEDGYRSRLDLVKEALEINPFMEKAYRRYMTIVLQRENIRSQTVDQLFLDLEHYENMNSYSDSARFTLADAYLERGEIIKARRIYLDLYDKYKDRSFVHYGLGVTHFRISRRYLDFKDFTPDIVSEEDARTKAIKNFNDAIAIDKHPNSYLYLGVIYDDIGDVDNAIKYYRLRIRNKIGDVDRYADEAKKGLRKIFEDSTILNRYLREENMLRDDVPANR